jgi:hypothetical protein
LIIQFTKYCFSTSGIITTLFGELFHCINGIPFFSASTGRRLAQQPELLACFKLASPALLQGYQQSARALDRSVRAVKDSKGSNSVCSFPVASRPVQQGRSPVPGAVATGP